MSPSSRLDFPLRSTHQSSQVLLKSIWSGHKNSILVPANTKSKTNTNTKTETNTKTKSGHKNSILVPANTITNTNTKTKSGHKNSILVPANTNTKKRQRQDKQRSQELRPGSCKYFFCCDHFNIIFLILPMYFSFLLPDHPNGAPSVENQNIADTPNSHLGNIVFGLFTFNLFFARWPIEKLTCGRKLTFCSQTDFASSIFWLITNPAVLGKILLIYLDFFLSISIWIWSQFDRNSHFSDFSQWSNLSRGRLSIKTRF